MPSRAFVNGAAAMLVLLGAFGAAMLYGEGSITPAISVLSVVEGLRRFSSPTGAAWPSGARSSSR